MEPPIVKRSILIIFMTHEEAVTEMAVASLLPQMTDQDTLLLLHNGAAGPSFRDKYSSLPRVDYYEADTNLGVAKGRNLLLEQEACQESDLVFLVDNDAIVPSDYLDRMTQFMDETPEAGVVGPVVLDYIQMRDLLEDAGFGQVNEDGVQTYDIDSEDVLELVNKSLTSSVVDHLGTNPAWQDAYLRNVDAIQRVMRICGAELVEPFHVGLKFSKEALETLSANPTKIDVTNIAGCCQVFRRSLVKEIGALYDLYSPYGLEDVDFCVRALEAGKRNYTTNSTYMLHKTDKRHAERVSNTGAFGKSRNDSRVRTIFEYRWARDEFPRISCNRILRRSLRQMVERNGESGKVLETLIAELMGVRDGLSQLAATEKEFVEAIKRHALAGPLQSVLSILLDETARSLVGLSEDLNASRTLDQCDRSGAVPLRTNTRALRELQETARGLGERGVHEVRRRESVSDVEKRMLRGFKDRHKGKRCFIIGNGPSLNKTDFTLLRDEITFAVNGIFYLHDEIGFYPTYYVVEDNHVIDDNLGRIVDYPATAKFFPARYRRALGELPATYYLPADWEFYYKSSPHHEMPRFSRQVEATIFVGQTVTYLNLQLAHYMGFSEVVLIGVDFDYKVPASSGIDGLTIISKDDDPNHFHPEYFGRGKKWHFPKLENCEKVYRYAKACYEEDGRKVVDATIDGKLEVYEKVGFYDLFQNVAQLGKPNRPVTFFVHNTARELIDSGIAPLLTISELGEPDLAEDLVTLNAWVKANVSFDSAGESARVTVCDPTYFAQSLPIEDHYVFILDPNLLLSVDSGAHCPGDTLSVLLANFREVLLHADFALAVNGTMPVFVEERFGLKTEPTQACMNPRAALAQVRMNNAGRRVVVTKLHRFEENVYDLDVPAEWGARKDLSLAAALLEAGTPVILDGDKLYFPR